MIFWLFVILLVLGVSIMIATKKISDKHSYKNPKKFVDFVWENDDIFGNVGLVISSTAGFVIAVMLIFIIPSYLSINGFRALSEKRYEALIYKAKTESIRDEFGIINKEYIDEVQAWNEEIAKKQAYSQNFWIGIFYPQKVYKEFECIDLNSIEMKE